MVKMVQCSHSIHKQANTFYSLSLALYFFNLKPGHKLILAQKGFLDIYTLYQKSLDSVYFE